MLYYSRNEADNALFMIVDLINIFHGLILFFYFDLILFDLINVNGKSLQLLLVFSSMIEIEVFDEGRPLKLLSVFIMEGGNLEMNLLGFELLSHFDPFHDL